MGKPINENNQEKSYITVPSLQKRTKTSYFADVEMNEEFVYKNFNKNGRIKRFNQLFKSKDCDLKSNIITNTDSNDKCDWKYNLCLSNVACGSRHCKHHKKFLIFGNKFKCKYSGVTINIKQNLNCNSCNVIYAIICLKCEKTGIDSTEISIKNRINKHIYDIMNENIGCMVVKHFNECCFEMVNGEKDPLFYFSFKIIAKVPIHRNILQNMHALWKTKTYYQKLLFTTEYGINDDFDVNATNGHRIVFKKQLKLSVDKLRHDLNIPELREFLDYKYDSSKDNSEKTEEELAIEKRISGFMKYKFDKLILLKDRDYIVAFNHFNIGNTKLYQKKKKRKYKNKYKKDEMVCNIPNYICRQARSDSKLPSMVDGCQTTFECGICHQHIPPNIVDTENNNIENDGNIKWVTCDGPRTDKTDNILCINGIIEYVLD